MPGNTTLPYDYPTNITNVTGMFQHVDKITTVDGLSMFGLSFIVMVYIIPFMALKEQYGTEDSLVVSGWIATISGYLLLILNLVPAAVPIFFTIILLMTLMLTWLFRKEDV